MWRCRVVTRQGRRYYLDSRERRVTLPVRGYDAPLQSELPLRDTDATRGAIGLDSER